MQKKVLMGVGAVGLACLALRKHLNTATYEGQSCELCLTTLCSSTVCSAVFRTRKTAFLGGVATAMAGVAAVCCVGYLRQPRMERVFAKVLPMLRANEEVRTAIGSNLRPGSLRMHLRAGGWQLRSPFYTTRMYVGAGCPV